MSDLDSGSKWIIVNSHRRSGTHFLIDSLVNNSRECVFPTHRNLPVDFNIGSLDRKSDAIYRIFSTELAKKRTTIIKSHYLPNEILADDSSKYSDLKNEIFKRAKKIYIYRNPKSVLKSLYLFRERDISFQEFLYSKNDHFLPGDPFKYSDFNYVQYLAAHYGDWIHSEDSLAVRYEDLMENFESTLDGLFDFLEIEKRSTYLKPKIPKLKSLHKLKLKLAKYGLPIKISNTSIKPGHQRGLLLDFRDQDENHLYDEFRKRGIEFLLN